MHDGHSVSLPENTAHDVAQVGYVVDVRQGGSDEDVTLPGHWQDFLTPCNTSREDRGSQWGVWQGLLPCRGCRLNVLSWHRGGWTTAVGHCVLNKKCCEAITPPHCQHDDWPKSSSTISCDWPVTTLSDCLLDCDTWTGPVNFPKTYKKKSDEKRHMCDVSCKWKECHLDLLKGFWMIHNSSPYDTTKK